MTKKILGAFGVATEEHEDGFVVHGTGGRLARAGRVESHGDHRIENGLRGRLQGRGFGLPGARRQLAREIRIACARLSAWIKSPTC